ncbi:hypothetical protein GCM10027047_11080 [Rhodococcus aerolatus]
MAFRWRYEDADGAAVDGPAEEFDDQAEAEGWFSDVWPDLRAAGVAQVVLLDGEARVYGPMGLDEA